jgi:MFS family permease
MAKFSDSSSPFVVLLQKNYGLYTAGSTISLFGMWAHKLAVAWLAWELTGSSFWVGMVAAADLVPTLFVTPFAGVAADRYDRRIISQITQVLGMGQALVLAWLVLTGRMTEHSDIWWLMGWSLFLGIVWAFNTAARLSMVPNLVEHSFIPPAVAINSAIFNLARIVGPAMGAWIIFRWGVGEAFLFNAFTFLFFIAALHVLRPVRKEESARGTTGVWSAAADGLIYARRHPGIGPMLILLLAVAMGGKALLELLPEFADSVFGRGERGLGELTATSGVGALIAAVWLANRGHIRGLTQMTIGALLLSAGSIFTFALSDNYPLALAGIFMLGVAGVFGGTATQTLMQHVVEGGMRARVMSLYGMIHRGAPALGAVVMGAMAEVIGIQAAAASGGILCLAAWVILSRKSKQLAAVFEAGPGK